MLIDVPDKCLKTLLAALNYWVEENYDRDGICTTDHHRPDLFQGDAPLTASEVEDLIKTVNDPGETRYLLYDIDERITHRDTYTASLDAFDDPYAGLPDVIVRPFLTGGPFVAEVEDVDDP